MIMLGRIANYEHDRNFPVETFNILRRKIGFRIKNQPINTAVQRKGGRQQILNPAIRISCSFADMLPTPVGSFEFKPNRNSAGWPAAGRVENVCGDFAHC